MSDRPDRNITKIAIEHRELPVDVPDSFVGVVKTTPRYPPPAPLSSTRSTSSTSATAGKALPPQESEKARKYAEEVRLKEEELLRSSLRGSKKLQQLEQQQHQQQKRRKGSADAADGPPSSSSFPSHSLINPAFEPDFDNNVVPVPANKVLPDMESVMQRLSAHMSAEVKEALSPESRVARLLSIYVTVMHEREKRLSLPATSMPSVDLIQEIIAILQRLPLDVSVCVWRCV